MKVFLGGTCAESTWRDELIPMLAVDYFNPVVDDWTVECQAEEERQKEQECGIHLYVITKEMTGVFSIAEVVQSSNNKNVITVFQVIPDGFNDAQLRSLYAALNLVKSNGAICYSSEDLECTAYYLNHL